MGLCSLICCPACDEKFDKNVNPLERLNGYHNHIYIATSRIYKTEEKSYCKWCTILNKKLVRENRMKDTENEIKGSKDLILFILIST